MTNSFNRLLREALKAPALDPPGRCLDPETVAAWCDGTLDAASRAAAEAHAAACERCQALMAAMMRSEPAVAQRPWWRSPAFGWLAPLTVAAAAVLIWVGLPERRQSPSEADAAAQPSSAAASAPLTTPATAEAPPEPERLRESSKAAAAPPAGRLESRAPSNREATSRPPASAAAAPPVATERVQEAVGTTVDPATRLPPVVAPEPSSAPARAQADAALAAAPPPQAPATAPIQARPAPQAQAGALTESVNIAADAARVDSARAQREIVVPSADGSTRWRITTSGMVQRSIDRGLTWENQPTGESAILTAGAAPSNTVCWLVGRGGVVLLTTDGRSWRRVPFPQTLDLIAVAASNDRQATVTAASGAKFTTTDGGRSWR